MPMYSLTPALEINIFSLVLFLFLVGVIFFICSMLLLMFFFGINIKQSLANTRGLIILFLLSMMVPFLVGAVVSPVNLFLKADNKMQLTNLEIVSLDEKRTLINFDTSKPAIAYGEYLDSEIQTVLPILPTYSLKKRTEHSLLITPTIKNQPIVLVINGQRYVVNGEPIIVPLNSK